MTRTGVGRYAALLAVAVLSVLGTAGSAQAAPTAGATVSGAAPVASAAGPLAATPGLVRPLPPARILDTRTGLGGFATVAAHNTVAVQVTGVGGVPFGAGAVVLNVTAVRPDRGGYVTVYPHGSHRPVVSNLNLVSGRTVPNLVLVKVGDAGKVDLYNGTTGAVDLLADVAGYVVAGDATGPGAVQPLAPVRILDTRTGLGGSTTVAPRATLHLQVTGAGGVPLSGAGAVIMNLTAVRPQRGGYITAFPTWAARPVVSNLNLVPGRTVPNLVMVKIGHAGMVNIYNGTNGTVDLLADVAGYVVSGSAAEPGAVQSLDPVRILDTRTGLGGSTTVAPRATVHLQVTGAGGIPPGGVGAVVLNVTAVRPERNGYITVHPSGGSRPLVSNLNLVPGRTVPNLVMVKVGAGGGVDLYNGTNGTVDLLADVAGYVVQVPPIDLTWDTPVAVDPPQGDLSAVSCPTSTFCVAVDVHGNALTWDGDTWTPPTAVDPGGHGLTDVSCASDAFCVAVDTDGNALTWDGDVWSTPEQVAPDGPLVDVDCPSDTFCRALDQSGAVAAYDAGTWTAPVPLGLGGASALDCASATFCAAVDTVGRAYVFDGVSWSAPSFVSGDAFTAMSISCPAVDVCMAVNAAGNAVSYDGTGWSAPEPTDLTGGPFTLSCTSASFCVATDSASSFVVFDGSWGPASPAPTERGLVPLSCPTETFCMAVGIADAVAFDGVAWGTPQRVDPDAVLTDISCASDTFCVLVDSIGRASVWDGGSATPFTDIDGGRLLTSVSCASGTFCVAVDDDGYAVEYDNGSWAAPESIAPAGGLTSVSCPAPNFCAAVSSGKGPPEGFAQTFDGLAWTVPSAISSTTLVSVACSSATFCAAIDDVTGTATTFDGGGWTPVATADPAGYTSAVSCPAGSFCVAVGDSGAAEFFTGLAWAPPTRVDPGGGLTDVSCATEDMCVAVGAAGAALTYNGSSWTAPQVVTAGGAGLVAVSCPVDSFCAAIDTSGAVLTAHRT